eukprot:scaffold313283_cov17-Tisochrysis_lutea.AAC.1
MEYLVFSSTGVSMCIVVLERQSVPCKPTVRTGCYKQECSTCAKEIKFQSCLASLKAHEAEGVLWDDSTAKDEYPAKALSSQAEAQGAFGELMRNHPINCFSSFNKCSFAGLLAAQQTAPF